MSTLLFANNAKSSLAGAISNTATSMTLATGTGAEFPNPGANQYYVTTLTDLATGLLNEIIWVTARSGDVCTIVRAQEGTTALNWNAGDLAQNRLTAGSMAAFEQTSALSVRTALTQNTTFYVSTTGSDSTGNGTSGAPWLTVGHALSVIQMQYDLAGYGVTIQLANGTYASAITASGAFVGQVGPSSINIQGNTLTPTSVVVSGTILAEYGASLTVSDLQLGGGATCLQAGQGGQISIGTGITFGTSSGSHIGFNLGGIVLAQTNYTIAGGAAQHIGGQSNGVMNLGASNITITGTPVFSGAFVGLQGASALHVNGSLTFTGSATGTRYTLGNLSLVDGTSGAANFFPGNAAGSAGTGSVYN